MKSIGISSTKFLALFLMTLSYSQGLIAQEEGLNAINIQDLQGHLYFLSSDELDGRATADPSIHTAARYLAGELKKLGFNAVDGDKDYYQYYTMIKNEFVWDSCMITMDHGGETATINEESFYFFPYPQENINITGEVVFAGYGISLPGEEFDEYSGIDVTDKIVVVMDGAPLDEEGNSRIEDVSISGYYRFFYKLMTAQSAGAKAVIYVYPPNSKYDNLLDEQPGFGSFLSESIKMEGDDESGQMNVIPGVTTKLIMTGREVAEHLLEGTGKTLADLQNKIDRELKPGSFLIPDKKVTIQARVEESCLEVPNIIGYLEGSDPEYKHEVVVYSAHFDHLGSRSSEQIFNGADDNASGSTALLELAEAYTMLRQKPKRSILFLWVSGEEIGLFGSRFYSNNPVIPLENTLVDINLDMVGRVKTDADTGSSVFMTDRETVFVIGGHQSTGLREINNKVFEKMRLTPDYSLGDLEHPDRLYYRSDHFNFARNDVPALFFTTGLHADYHTIRDTYDRIDFEKFLAVTRLAFMVGYEVANRTERIEVDNPFSSWEQ